jgi:hypothetical protein
MSKKETKKCVHIKLKRIEHGIGRGSWSVFGLHENGGIKEHIMKQMLKLLAGSHSIL